MSVAAIPHWTRDGVLPPVDALSPTSPARSPYAVPLSELVLRFGDSPERRAILNGFLRYRALLHSTGLVDGFQWLDGSFMEDVEGNDRRAPNDIDVVTFYRLPQNFTQAQLLVPLAPIVDSVAAKSEFRVDGYLVDLGQDAERLVRWTAYWYSIWSHRRDERWKGFVQVRLSPDEDAGARAALSSAALDGGSP